MGRSYIPLNSVAASAADLTVGGGKFYITGDPNGITRRYVDSFAINRYRPAVASELRVAATATVVVGQEYSFIVRQDLRGRVDGITTESKAIVSVTATSATAATFAAQIAAAATAVGARPDFDFTAAAYTSGNGGVDITGGSSQPVVIIEQPVLMTLSDLLNGGASSGNASYSGTAITVLHGTTTDIVVGGQVTFSGWSGGAIVNGRTAAEGVTLPVTAVTASTSFVLAADAITGTMSAAVAAFQVIAQEQAGAGSQYIADGITAGGNPSVSIVSTNNYHDVVIKGGEVAGTTNGQKDLAEYEKHFLINSGDADAKALLARIIEVKKYFSAGATTADPNLL